MFLRKILKINNFGLVIIVLLAIIPLFDLLNPGLPITHDGVDHVARIANFYDGLREGIIFPRWAENLNWGYGHPVLMFLYPFSSYLASFFHFLGFSYVDSLKIIFGLGFISSGVTMYLWARSQFDEYIGIAATVFYLFAPYRFIDLYVRGAIGEHMAFIFPPLVLFFLLKFFKANQLSGKYLHLTGLSISFALFLLSHNAISLMFIPLFGVYGIYLAHTSKKLGWIIYPALAFVCGLFLSGFFTFPAFFEGKYTLRDIVTGDDYMTRFVMSPLNFLYGKWNFGITGQFSVQLGVMHMLSLLLLPFIFIQKKASQKIRTLIFIFVIFFLLSIFLQLSISNFLYEIFTTLKKFQFPWRFLSLTAFTLSVLASVGIYLFPTRLRKYILILMILGILITTFPFWKAKGYSKLPDSNFEKIYNGTTDTGESAPIWSVRFMENAPKSPIEVIDGKAEIIVVMRKSNMHKYKIKVESDKARIKENTLYFPGWHVYANNKIQEIEFQDPANRGLITFSLSRGSYEVELKFEETKLRFLSNVLSIVTVILITICGFLIFLKK